MKKHGSAAATAVMENLEPLHHFRAAMLTLAIALSAVILSLILLVTVIPTPHVMWVDLGGELSDAPVVRVAIDRRGDVAIDGAPCSDLLELRQALDWYTQQSPSPQIWLEPDAQTRHEDFVQALVVLKQARAEPARVDLDPPSWPPLAPGMIANSCDPMRGRRQPGPL
uniref:ExbD/TolR family protein n=1 Tax=uncultured Sphingomonas sp. TaxID=158754 RepID=UPI0025EA147A|nr:biopolymer transporter ExbD [uncultured Sphingomonas sp.]